MNSLETVSTLPPSLEAHLESLYLVIRRCATQFQSYERQHRAKGTDEANAKAEVNAQMAEMCRSAVPVAGAVRPTIYAPGWATAIDDRAAWKAAAAAAEYAHANVEEAKDRPVHHRTKMVMVALAAYAAEIRQ